MISKKCVIDFSKNIIYWNVISLLILISFSSINGNIIFSFIQPLKSGPFIFDPNMNFKLGSDLSTISPLSILALTTVNLLIFIIAWIPICITIYSLSKKDNPNIIIFSTVGFLMELFLIGLVIHGPFWSLFNLFLPATIFVSFLFFAFKNYSNCVRFVMAIRTKLARSTKRIVLMIVLFLLSLIVLLPTVVSGYPQLNLGFTFEVYLLLVWNVILVFVFGIASWFPIRNYIISTADLDTFDLLAIFPIGFFSLSVITIILLELRLFSIFSLLITFVLMLVYIQRKFNFAKVLKNLIEVFVRHSFQIILLSSIVVFIFLLYTWGSNWLSLQWFDTWHWWGNAYQEAITGTIYGRYSTLFPGTTGMLASGFITSTIVLLPDKIISLFYIRTLPIIITILQVFFIFHISRLIIMTYFEKYVSVAILSVVAFLSSSWIIFYGTYYARESVNILLVLLVLLFSLKYLNPDKNKTPDPNFFRKIVFVTLLGSITIYLSEIEWLFIYSSIAISIILLMRRNSIISWSRSFVGFLLGSLSMLPYFLLKLRSYALFTNSAVKETIPNLNLTSSESPVGKPFLSLLSSLIPSFSINNLDNISKTLGYSIINSIGFFGFMVALIGAFFISIKLLRKNFQQILVVYGILLICFPLILFFWPNAAVTLDLQRRFVPQLSIFLSISFAVGIAFLLKKIPHQLFKRSVAIILLSVILFSQVVYPVQSISHMGIDSQTEVSEIMLQLDKKLPSDYAIVADTSVIDQAEGLLSPRNVIRGEFFASLFDQIGENKTQQSVLQNYLNSENVIILAIPSPFSVLNKIVDNVATLDVPLIPLGEVGLLQDNSYRTFVAILSNKTLAKDFGNSFQLTSSNLSSWKLDVKSDVIYEEKQSIYWNISSQAEWHDLSIPLLHTTNINDVDYAEISLNLEKSTDLIQVFIKDSLQRRNLIYVDNSVSKGPAQLTLNFEKSISKTSNFDSSDIVELTIAYHTIGNLENKMKIIQIYGFNTYLKV